MYMRITQSIIPGMIFWAILLLSQTVLANLNASIRVGLPVYLHIQNLESISLAQGTSVEAKIQCFNSRDLSRAIISRGGPNRIPAELRVEVREFTPERTLGFSLYWKNQQQSQRILKSIPKKCSEQLAFVAVSLLVALDSAIPPSTAQKDDRIANQPSSDTESKSTSTAQRPTETQSTEAKSIPIPQSDGSRAKQTRTPQNNSSQSKEIRRKSRSISSRKSLLGNTPRRNANTRSVRIQRRLLRRQEKNILKQQRISLRQQARLTRAPVKIRDTRIHTGGFVSLGLLPEVAGGAQLDYEIDWSIPLSLRVGLLTNHGSQQKVGHGRADITLAAAEIALCTVANERRVHAYFCLAAASGPVLAQGTSFSENRFEILPWVAPSGQIRVRIDINARWGILIHSAAYVPILRLRLVIDGETPTRVSFPRLGGLISIGPTFRFGK